MNAVGTATSSSAPLSGAAANQRKIQDAIKQYVLTNGLAPGDPMPTEPELMAMLKISRNALREAMKALQALGFIEIRHGFGTYVGKPNMESLQAGLTFRMQRSVAVTSPRCPTCSRSGRRSRSGSPRRSLTTTTHETSSAWSG